MYSHIILILRFNINCPYICQKHRQFVNALKNHEIEFSKTMLETSLSIDGMDCTAGIVPPNIGQEYLST